jgi:CBS domain containing-hemolysin-like protein
MLLAQSHEHGLLPADQHHLLTRLLALETTTVQWVTTPRERIVTVPADADAVEAAGA